MYNSPDAELIAYSNQYGNVPEIVRRLLAPGEYYLRVYRFSGYSKETPYALIYRREGDEGGSADR